jgi:nucleoside-diphosphate-sugar epimerase
MQKTLVIGSGGQIGVEIVRALAEKQGTENVFASDIHERCPDSLSGFNYITLNTLDKVRLKEIVEQHQITDVYLLAALLSATAEKNIAFAWELNMDGLFHVLNLAKEGKIKKVFWPSSIAVFGPTTPRINTPQQTVMEPTTVYGISKLAGELWCSYYHRVFGCRCAFHSLSWLDFLPKFTWGRYNRLRSRHFLPRFEKRHIHIIFIGKHSFTHDVYGRCHSRYFGIDGRPSRKNQSENSIQLGGY